MNSHGNSRLPSELQSFLLVTNELLGFEIDASAGRDFAFGRKPILPVLTLRKMDRADI
jgi:hypothetical protein